MSLNNISTPSPLLVYKASAGSGKTFTLAVEYIKYLIANTKAYEGILAVTFTNKATEEMKMRIMSQLYGLSRKLPDSQDYMDVLVKDTHADEDTIARASGEALHNLLHNYHYFKVQTIDKFFQAVLHNLAHELQLNSKLHSAINNKYVVQQAVNELIDTLDAGSPMMKVIMGFIDEKISDQKSWSSVISSMKSFGENIFTETYKSNRKNLDRVFDDPEFFSKYKSELFKIQAVTSERYKKYGEQALTIISSNGLDVEDFAKKSKGPFGYFLKLSKGNFYDGNDLMNKTIQEARENVSKWHTSKSPNKSAICEVVTNDLLPLIDLIETTRSQDAILYNSAAQTLGQLNNVQLLRDIELKAREMNDAAQRFMLSDTQNFLHEMIGDSDAPFIFEKLGSRLQHVMIDEFQDTSVVQWANFKVLLQECISRNLTNLIVGDVKQSIYRFRSGDWRLLNNIENEFAPEEMEFDKRENFNFRSLPNVVHFNNFFFQKLAEIEVNGLMRYDMDKALQLQNAYSDVIQTPAKKGTNGLVHVEVLSSNLINTMERRILDIIFNLLENDSIRQKDICILTRKNDSIPVIAKYIEEKTQGQIKVVSDEAFRLDASQAVNIIIRCMKLLVNPNDSLSLAIISNECDGQIPEEFLENINTIAALPLYEIAEEILRIFNLGNRYKEGAYLTVFFDYLHEFCNTMMPVIQDFLVAWNEEYCEKTIEVGDIDGVRITTIHKSKGLEYPHVIIPYCNWSFNARSSLIWAEPRVKPFNKLPLVPLSYFNVTTFENTIYRTEGYDEYVQTVVENLNFLYVAFTRAEKSLFVISEQTTDTEKTRVCSSNIFQIIQNFPSELNDVKVHVNNSTEMAEDGSEGSVLTLTYGELHDEEKKTKSKTKNIFLSSSDHTGVTVESCSNHAQFRESNRSREFAEDATDVQDRLRVIRRGTVLHQLFSRIRTFNDIDTELMRMEFDGTLFDSDTTKEDVINELSSRFDNPTVRSWFDPHWTVLNERTILLPGNDHDTVRPDRVITDGHETIVIDFKFGIPNSDYEDQVREYMDKLREMKMPAVKGYLWYVTRNVTQEVPRQKPA